MKLPYFPQGFDSYDDWKLATPPEYNERDGPNIYAPRPRIRVVCKRCGEITAYPKDGLCPECP